jgi:hypothetical protein
MPEHESLLDLKVLRILLMIPQFLLVWRARARSVQYPALFSIFYYCHTTWTDSAVMLRRELVRL